MTYVKCIEQFLGHGRYSINVSHCYNFFKCISEKRVFPLHQKGIPIKALFTGICFYLVFL